MIPHYKFEFLDLEDLFAEANKSQPGENPEFAIDIIGVIEEYENVKRIDTKFGDRDIVKFRICDSSNAHKVTIWGDLALSVEEMYVKQLEKPIIAILTSTKVTKFINSVQIATLPSTKVYINLDDEAVTDMRLRLIAEEYHLKAEKSLISSRPEQILTFFEKLSLKDLNENLTYDHLKKIICCSFTIMKVDEDSSWWFYSCNKCQSEVESFGNRFKCSDCPRIIPVAPKRFRIMVLAEDSTFSCNIVLMDRTARRILGTSAAKVLDDLKKVPEEGIPKRLQTLVGKEISVQLKLNKSNVTQDSTFFQAEDIYDTTLSTPSTSENPCISDASSVDLTDNTFEVNDFMQTPGSAKSVTKKIKMVKEVE
ncbi:hypothetical protein POM88_011571 [Heracleum sosnowskyi]|uniref:Replication factor A C-terminal domain-containing protein n=1 Tax=Heracleum sosnowskyi TaxID=360622 RepID=A0AAD8IYK7_9APIA|nr:hypothetical protein POM88_011571 [Heracleum sosnowskyi]